MPNDPDLEDLVNPDEPKDVQYTWDTDFQRSIISMLLVDRHFLLQSMDLIKPTYFVNIAHSKACGVLFDYYRKYHSLPTKTILLQEVKEQVKTDKAKSYYLGEITSLYDCYEIGLDSREYLSNKITFFAKIQAMKEAFQACLAEIAKKPEADETWSWIYDRLRKAMNTDRNFDVGLEYFVNLRERYARMSEEEGEGTERFLTGFPGIDLEIKGGGYKRGEMIAVVGHSGHGKSLYLTNIAATNAKMGKKVCYISTELSQDRVAERFDAVLTGTSVHTLLHNKEMVMLSLEAILQEYFKSDANPIVIKHFPGKTADVNTIRAYMSQLSFYGFKPDVVIVDYVGEMKDYAGIPTHESRERMIGELRGLAAEEDVFMASAFQPNRGSKEVVRMGGVIDDEHLADAFGQVRPLDGLSSINQSEAEASIGIGCLYQIKQRFGRSRYKVYIRIDRETLRITEISKEEYRSKMATRTEKVSDEVAIDNIVKSYVPSDAKGKKKKTSGDED